MKGINEWDMSDGKKRLKEAETEGRKKVRKKLMRKQSKASKAGST